MLTQELVEIKFGDDWVADPPTRPHKLYRAASVGNSYGVTSIGRGFGWERGSDDSESSPSEYYHGSFLEPIPPKHERSKSDHDAARRRNLIAQNATKLSRPTLSPSQSSPKIPSFPNPIHVLRNILTENLSVEPSSLTPEHSRPGSPRAGAHTPGGTLRQMSGTSTPSSARPRSSRRSSQQRVSLVAGRVLIAPIDAPHSPIELLCETGPGGPRVKAPPLNHSKSFLGERKITEFSIEKEIGRGAYGLVKKAREIQADGSLGVRDHSSSLIHSSILKSTSAPTSHQTSNQVAYTSRLLEATPSTWHHPHRDTRDVCNLGDRLHPAPSPAMGSCTPYKKR